jgi:sulfide:quinone oxidoreductase
VAVEPAERCIVTGDGQRVGYDALLVACGTRMRPAFDGAHTIDDRDLGETLRGLIQDIEEGYTHDVTFVAPAQAFWPLPLYELALQTARRAFDMNAAVDISIVSPEAAPLELFGAGVSDELARLLRGAGIAFHGSVFADYANGALTLNPGGSVLRPSRVVALPVLEGPRIAGLPGDAHGFIPVGGLGEVYGLDGVYAAGDATCYPIKHGGLAAQQADVVATAIAARAGVAVTPRPAQPVIRGTLLTGGAPRYFEAELTVGGGFRSTMSDTCPWDAPAKIVARHLGPYLAAEERHAVRG